MKRSAAQKIVDSKLDERIEADLNGFLIELEHKANDTAPVIANYAQRIAARLQSHAIATEFVTKNFEE